MKRNLLVPLFFIIGIFAYGQYSLTKLNSSPRNGDTFSQQLIDYKNPGKGGENKFWDFSLIDTIEVLTKVKYRFFGDSYYMRVSNKTNYNYLIKGDTVYDCGFENHLVLMQDSISPKTLIYPLEYGKTFNSDFYYKGKYSENKFIESKGISTTSADAYGILALPKEDTLRNVLRTYTINDSFIRINNKKEVLPIDSMCDSLTRHKEEIYRWYAEGYRYPIIEMISHTYLKGIEPLTTQRIGYYYPIKDLMALNVDVNNDSTFIKNKEIIHKNSKSKNNVNNNIDDISKDTKTRSLIDNIAISSNSDRIDISYDIHGKNVEAELILSDILGRVYSYIPQYSASQGNNTNYIERNGLKGGEYILCIIINGKPYSKKIILN